MLARAAGIADPLELIDRQRGAYLQALRELDDVAAQADGDVTAALLVEGAALHLEADLKWLDLCEQRIEELTDGARDRHARPHARLRRRRPAPCAASTPRSPTASSSPSPGPSGCGKSTLLNLLGGLDRPTAGEIELGGRRVDGFSEAKWAHVRRSEIGFVFQFFNLIGNLSVADNVELPGLLAGLSAREARAAPRPSC